MQNLTILLIRSMRRNRAVLNRVLMLIILLLAATERGHIDVVKTLATEFLAERPLSV